MFVLTPTNIGLNISPHSQRYWNIRGLTYIIWHLFTFSLRPDTSPPTRSQHCYCFYWVNKNVEFRLVNGFRGKLYTSIGLSLGNQKDIRHKSEYGHNNIKRFAWGINVETCKLSHRSEDNDNRSQTIRKLSQMTSYMQF